VDPHSGKVLFRDFANDWLASRPDLRPRSVRQYRSLLDCHLIPAFGEIPIVDVSPSRVRTWYSAVVAKKTPGAATSAYRLLRAIFNTAVHDELLAKSPCRIGGAGADRAVERPKLTRDEVEALTNGVPEKLKAAVALAAWGALRRGEVLALRRRDVDPLRSLVRVERAQVELNNGTVLFADPKTDAGIRSVHLPDRAMQVVNDHLAANVEARPDSLLFTGRGGVPLRSKTLATAFTKARTACGLPHVRFHDLRHFSLTMAAATGASTKELMRRGGHASPAAALRYQHATEDRDKAIADALTAMEVRASVVPLGGRKKRHSRP
jgi:integrase